MAGWSWLADSLGASYLLVALYWKLLSLVCCSLRR